MVKINNPPSVHAEDHAARHSDAGGDEVTIENLGTAGGAGTVPLSDGAGAVAMTDVETAAEAATHAALATVHQDAPGLIATHAALPTDHQDAPALIATHAALPTDHQDAPALIATHAALATPHQDAPALIATHAAISDAHQPPGMVLEGVVTTEATTTSLTAVDLLTVALLNIAAATPFKIFGSARKDPGASNGAGVGLKLNTVVVQEATSAGDTSQLWTSGFTNEDQSGAFDLYVGPRVTNHLRGATRSFGQSPTDSVSDALNLITADMPTVAITDVIIRGISASTMITLGVTEVRVISLPV